MMKDQIRDFLSKHIKGRQLQDDDDIFGLGLVSSLFAMELVLYVEQQFEIEVSGDDLDISNLRTVNAIAALVERNLALNAK
jgi:acyl carrier protein